MTKEIGDILNDFGTVKLGFESKRLSYYQYQKLVESIKESRLNITLVPVDELLDNFRIIKDEHEISVIKKSLEISEKALEAADASAPLWRANEVKPGWHPSRMAKPIIKEVKL